MMRVSIKTIFSSVMNSEKSRSTPREVPAEVPEGAPAGRMLLNIRQDFSGTPTGTSAALSTSAVHVCYHIL